MSIFQSIERLQKTLPDFKWFPFRNALQPYLVLLLISLGLYLNTFNHEIAFDDESAMIKNEYVIKGFSGIPGILTHDSYYSYYKQLGISNGLPGGRYRPLSQITFAVEQEFIGTIPDGIITNQSWDINQNEQKDQFEDVNKDGLFNDYDFMIKGAGIRHAVNVFLYAFLILLLYHFLINYIFYNSKDMVFFAMILFAVHPLHTEVIANIKSRDEILSLLFITLTFLFSFRYLKSFSNKDLVFTAIFMWLALLSKEYALVLFFLLPATIYIFQNDKLSIKDINFWILVAITSLAAFAFIWFFNSGTLIAVPILFFYGGYYFSKNSRFPVSKIVYMLGIALTVYLGMRFSATIHDVTIESFDEDILANPYLYASPTQEFASKISVWFKYVELFFVPAPLLADYSYSTIPYANFLSPIFWLSILFFGGLCIGFVLLFFRRNVITFPILLFIGFFLPVANIFIDIGAVMGERLFFHSSLGMCLLISIVIFYFLNKLNADSIRAYRSLYLTPLIIVVLSFFYLSFSRNLNWKNNTTLFLADVKKAPNNINVVTAAGTAYYELSLLPVNDSATRINYAKKADSCFSHGIKIHYDYFPAHLNKSINLLTLGMLDSSLKYVENVLKMIPGSRSALSVKSVISEQYMLRGQKRFVKGNEQIALKDLDSAIKVYPNNFVAWNNMGKAFARLSLSEPFDSLKKIYFQNADSCFSKSIGVNKDYFPAYLNKSENLMMSGDLDGSLKYIELALKLIPENSAAVKIRNSISDQFMLQGIASLKENNFNAGLKQITKALSVNKQNVQAWNVMGRALENTNALDKALLCYQTALKFSPENKMALQGIHSIDSLKKIGVGKGKNQ